MFRLGILRKQGPFFCSSLQIRMLFFGVIPVNLEVVMKDTGNRFRASARNLKNIRSLTVLAMLGALSVIIGYLSSQIGNFIKITFTFLPHDTAAYLFGPVAASVLGAVMDILNYIVKPTGPFFPGFTISAVVSGLIVGCGLYRRPLSIVRICIVLAVNTLLVNIVLNTLWLSMLYGQAFQVLLAARIVKEVIMYPIQVVLLYLLLKSLERAGISGLVAGAGKR